MPRSLMPPALRALALLGLALPATAMAQGSYPATPAPSAAVAPAEPGLRHFHIITVHFDGLTGLTASAAHPAEAFPTTPLPAGGGLLLRQPDAEGTWNMRAFVFSPAQLVVRQGEQVALTFIDVQGPSFRISVDGQGEPFEIRRGETRTIRFTADRPGPIGFRALDRLPSMTGEVLVLPR